MVKLNGIIPKDLLEKTIDWQSFPFLNRCSLVRRNLFKESPELKRVLIASSMIEQPRLIPNCNAFGFGIWNTKFPWGWKTLKKFWMDWSLRPDGYILANEGQTPDIAVLFSFPNFTACFLSAFEIFKSRNIKTFADYERYWLGKRNPNAQKDWQRFYERTII